MKRLVLEPTAPFQGLPEPVAHDEGLNLVDLDLQRAAHAAP